MTQVQYTYVGDLGQFDAELTGHDPQVHAEQTLTAWLKSTLDPDADPEGEGEWQVDRIDVFSDRVVVTAVPYRGEGVTFLFSPPEA